MDLPKGVELLTLTPDKVKELWDRLHVIDGLFDDMTKGNYQHFLARLYARDSVYLERSDGNGIIYVTQVIPGLSAFGHVVYWDKRLRGREDSTIECLQWFMDVLQLRKINVWLPDYAKAAIAFAKRIGFKHEGTLRNWSYSNGRLFNMEAFGITKEEVLNERLHETGSAGIRRSTSGASEELVSELGTSADADISSGDNEPLHDESSADGDTGHATVTASGVTDGKVSKPARS